MIDAGRLIASIIGLRRGVLGFVAVLTALAVLGASRVGVDNAVEIWFPDDDPALEAYHQFLDTFGNDEVVVIGVHSDDTMLTEAGLERIRAVGDAAREIPGVARVRSVATEALISDVDGGILVAPAEDAAQLRTALGRDPLVDGLMSQDGSTALVLAEMEAMGDIDAKRDGIIASLKAEVRAVDLETSFAGIGVIYAALNQASTVDAAGIIVASYLLILVLLRLLMGRWRPVMLTLSVVGLGAIWLLGVYGASGKNINMVTMVMPTLVLVIGVSDCVHMLVHVAAQPESLPPLERVKAGVGAVIWPCLFNTLTTAMGFLALASATMPVIQDLGIFCALGLIAAFIGSLLLCTLYALKPAFLPVQDTAGLVQRTVDGMASLAVTRPRLILVVAAGVGLLSAVGVSRVEVDTYSIDFLYDDHPARVDSARLEVGFGPYTPLEFVVHNEDTVKTPEILAAMSRWQTRMEADTDVGWTRSLADVVENLDRVLMARPEGRIPEDSASLEQILFLFDADADSDSQRFIDADETRARLTVGVPMGSASEIGVIIERLMAMSEMPAGTRIEAAGYLPLYVRIMDHIVASQLSSFVLAFGVIFTLIGLLFRSVRMALLAVPANLLPVLMTLGLMGLLGIRLDVATVTIAAIVLGLVVDDTTQFLYRYREMRRRHSEPRDVVFNTVRTVGRPMLITTVVLAGGFSVLGLAAIKSVAYFGLLLATALVSALLADLLVVPALLVVWDRR